MYMGTGGGGGGGGGGIVCMYIQTWMLDINT